MPASLQFLGAAGTVTGSKYLIQTAGQRHLVDCGLFQGFKNLRLRNWAPFPIAPDSIDAVVLTHAHLDHSGYLPLLARNGFKGGVYCSAATQDLCGILLPDAGHLEERDADFANRHNYSKHKPALPLFTEQDARNALPFFRSVAFGHRHNLGSNVTIQMRRAGHILGAASVTLQCEGVTITFSGDLGRFNDPIMRPPEEVQGTDYLIVESTYGNRKHDAQNPEDILREVISKTVHHGGTVIIPAFAVGRAQALMYHLDRLKHTGQLPKLLPVYLDSPMAQDASEIFCRHANDHYLTDQQCKSFCGNTIYVRDAQESKELTASPMPKVIISASGMATGGRVLHHLKRYAPDPKNAILFAGFQAGGTRGSAMIAGAESVKIHGEYVPVKATVANIESLSAHADADEILRWLSGFKHPPRTTFVTHGEPSASDALRHRIQEQLGWNCVVPEQNHTVSLS